MTSMRFCAAAELGLSLRPMTDDDLPFTAALYGSTRMDELALFGWPAEQQQAFLKQQHEAQDRHYRAYYPDAERFIVEQDGEPLGRLYLAEWEREFRVIDISLMPAARGRGFGSALLADVIAAATSVAKVVSVHVVPANPAFRLYEKLGFVLVEDKGAYLRLELNPAVRGAQ